MLFSKLLVLCVLILPTPNSAYCQDMGLYTLELTHASMEYKNINQGGIEGWYPHNLGVRDSYLAPLDEELTFGMGVNLDYNLIRYKEYSLFHRNKWSFLSASTHVREARWDYHLGVRFFDKVEVFHEHMSRHLLEGTREERFPVRDSFNIRIIFWDRP